MSTEVPGYVVLATLVVPGVLLVAFARSPQWFSRSMAKHSLWRLRDDVVDDTLAGRLPAGHPAVRELLERVQWAIKESRSFDLLHLLVWLRAIRHLPAESVRTLRAVAKLDGLSTEEAARVETYRMRYTRIAIKATLLTSWVGVAMLVRVGVPLAIQVLRHQARDNSFRVVVRTAADEVATETSLGRSARDFVIVKGPSRDREREVAAF